MTIYWKQKLHTWNNIFFSCDVHRFPSNGFMVSIFGQWISSNERENDLVVNIKDPMEERNT